MFPITNNFVVLREWTEDFSPSGNKHEDKPAAAYLSKGLMVKDKHKTVFCFFVSLGGYFALNISHHVNLWITLTAAAAAVTCWLLKGYNPYTILHMYWLYTGLLYGYTLTLQTWVIKSKENAKLQLSESSLSGWMAAGWNNISFIVLF